MSIKKQYVDILTLLVDNKDKKVSEVLNSVYELVKAQKNTNTSINDSEDKVFAIFCYYHKRWELVNTVDYGRKASSTTGLNTMCKLGVNAWTKTQKQLKDCDLKVLELVETGKLKPTDIKETKITLKLEVEEKIRKVSGHKEEFYHTSEQITNLLEIHNKAITKK